MVDPLAVLQSQTIDESETLTPLSLVLASSVLITRDASTPTGDPVIVTLDGVSVTAASAFTVQGGATLDVASALSVAAIGNIDIASTGTLELGTNLPPSLAVPISFAGPAATLILTQAGVNSDNLTGFTASDTIDFRGVAAATSIEYAGTTLTLLDGSTVVASETVTGTFGAETLQLTSDGYGGVSVGDNVGTVDDRLSGSNASYEVAFVSLTRGIVEDDVTGRDGSGLFANGQTLGFSNGVGIIDPSGNAETIAHLYQAVLGRTADLGGIELYTSQVNEGTTTTTTVASEFIASPEFTQKYGSLNNQQFVNLLAQNTNNVGTTNVDQAAVYALNAGESRGSIALQFAESSNNVQQTLSYSGDPTYGELDRLYQTTLGRAPDAGGLQSFTTLAQSGASLQEIANDFIGSTEYKNDFGNLSNSSYVTNLYKDGLGRSPDAAGLQSWLDALNSGASRATVALGISDSLESRLDTATATHDSWVFIAH